MDREIYNNNRREKYKQNREKFIKSVKEYYQCHKEQKRAYNKRYYEQNRVMIREQQKNYYSKNREKWQLKQRTVPCIQYKKKLYKFYKINEPWRLILYGIKCRCGKRKYYEQIHNFLTLEDLKKLWFRDKAYWMDWPSIDRINPNKHYTLDNCRFIENLQNRKMGLSNVRKTA